MGTSGILGEKIALVTGASRGIGAGIAKKLASLGAQVAINYRANEQAARATVEEIRKQGGIAELFAADVADAAAVRAMVAAVAERFGRIDILVNNAGTFGVRLLGEIDATFFAEQFVANTLSMILVTQEALRHFPASGGRIISVSSRLAYSPSEGTSVHAAAKAAVSTLTHAFARELGRRHITVNAVAPGPTETDMIRGMPPELRETIAAATPIGRMGGPADIAGLVACLASEDAGWVTGRTILVDGGLT